MKKVLIGIVGIVFLLSIITTKTYATMAESNIPSWTQCNYLSVHGQVVSAGLVGNDYVTISWIMPAQSWEWFAGCEHFGFTAVDIQIYVVHPGFVALTSNYYVSNPISYLTIFVHEELCGKVCVYVGDYHLHSGDHVAITITALYGGGLFQHSAGMGYGV